MNGRLRLLFPPHKSKFEWLGRECRPVVGQNQDLLRNAARLAGKRCGNARETRGKNKEVGGVKIVEEALAAMWRQLEKNGEEMGDRELRSKDGGRAGAVWRFGPNLSGRDFVVGDIHGEFSLVEEAMEAASFDPEVDRLFCVGDLIDRGSESRLAAKFLAKPKVFSVKGNHDDDLVKLARGPRSRVPKLLEIGCRQNNQMWWLALEPELREEIVAALEALPLAMEIETPQGLVCLVHAEPLAQMRWFDFADKLRSGDEEARDAGLWGRDIAESKSEGGCVDVWRVFAGHTPAPDGPMQRGNVFFIDTGAVFGRHGFAASGHLTLAQIDAPEEALMAPRSMPGLVEIRRAPTPAPSPPTKRRV